MTTKTRTRVRLLVALTAMSAMMFALVPASPASAGDLKVLVQGTATLGAGISAPCTSDIHPGRFTGTASGVHNTTTPVANSPVTADFRYCNSDTVAGTANGSISLAGHNCSFSWVRTGAIAVVSLSGCTSGGSPHSPSGGTAVAEFVPTSAPGDAPGTAQVVGQGVL